MNRIALALFIPLAWLATVSCPNPLVAADDLRILFLGDQGPHQPARRFAQLAPAMEAMGIQMRYTERMQDLNLEVLSRFDGLLLYANIDRIEDDQARAVLQFIERGNGFIPIHCASYCWRNNRDMVQLMGAQFQRHGGQVFSTVIARPDHPVMKNFSGFASWDETYIHHLHHEQDRTVLEYREQGEQAEGSSREPWTWVKTHGEGRVFYTAWGHDDRTWTHDGFQNLIARGIRWACGDDPQKVPAFADPDRFDLPEMTELPPDKDVFDYVDVGPRIPNYTPGQNWGEQGEPKNLMQLPLPPETSIQRMVHPVGMAVRLYADERDFDAKPIAMNWDERGRLWVCETVDYPNELGANRDRIRICEDTDGDAVADQFTVFATGLSIPTSILPFRGGAVVQSGTETIYLKDTDRDGTADQKTVLLTGWAMGDTHGGVSNFRYGLDNWIWAMQGYNYSSPKIDGEPTQSFRQGFWRFKLSQTDPPRVTDLEFVRSTDNNTWGLGISEEGLIFGSTANRNPSTFMPIPNRYYERVRGWAPSRLRSIADTHLFQPITDRVRQVDHFGGYTAAAGHALYTARAFPSQWWNKTAFVCGPTGHLVGTFILRRSGADFTSSNPLNLLASDDEWSAPIMAEVGPDGAVWVIDWYNFIVQHNPTPRGFSTGKGAAYESNLRDKQHGRIYRVVPRHRDQDQLHPYANLAQLANRELVNELQHPAFIWRLQAQRVLLERKATDCLEPLIELVNDPSVDAVGLNVGAIHALQTLGGLGFFATDNVPDELLDCLRTGLTHASPGVRRNALQVLPASRQGADLLFAHSQLCEDSDVQVRLQAILSLSDLPVPTGDRRSEAAGELIASLALRESDSILLDALTSAAATHAVPFLQNMLEAEPTLSRTQLQITRRIAEHLARGNPTPSDLQMIVASLNPGLPQRNQAVLNGFSQGLPSDFQLTPNAQLDTQLIAAFQRLSDEPRNQFRLLKLAQQCRFTALDPYAAEILADLEKTLIDTDAESDQRVAAAASLVRFRHRDDQVIANIVSQINAQTPPQLATRLLRTLTDSDAESVADQILDTLDYLTPQSKTAALAVVLTKPAWTRTLLERARNNQFDPNQLTLEQRQALRASADRDLRNLAETVLATSGGLPDADREKVIQSLNHVTEIQGDVTAGKAVFKEVCAACHMHSGEGNAIGPELTGMAVHPKDELLVHIMDPSRSVEGNYRLYNVLTVDGLVFNGMLAGESRTTITMIDSEANEHVIQRKEIDELAASPKSVMPEGYEQQLTEQQLANLLEFLTHKDRFLPVPLNRYATAVSTKPLFTDDPNGPDRLIFSDWKTKTFNGVPFSLTDPQGQSNPNIILLNGPRGSLPPQMPRSVSLPCNTAARKIHLLSGVGGWSYPYDRRETVSMIVRLEYADGKLEEHPLVNGVHFADYISRQDVPGSEFAFALRGQQIRYLAITPQREAPIKSIELVKGPDQTAPIVMAVTIECRDF